MSRQFIVLVVALCLAGCVVTEAGGAGHQTSSPTRRSRHDLALGVRHTLRLTRTAGGAYRLEEVGVQSMRLLSRRAARQRHLVVAHPYTAPTAPPQAWVAGKRIAASAISHRVAQQRDVFLSDFKLYQIDLGRPRMGDKVRVRFERRYLDLAFTPVFYLPNVDYLARYELVLEHPADVEVSFRTFYPRRPLRPRIEKSGQRTILRLDNVRQIEDLPLFAHNGYRAAFWPAFHDRSATLLPDSRERFAAWYRRALSALRGVSPSTVQQAKALLRGATTARETLQRLYDFTRREVRYVADERGINAWVPRPPGVVLDRRYGDCKDKAFLLQQLARAAGLRVEFVLVGVEAAADLPGVRLDIFDHAVARWQAPDGQQIYLDTTCAACEFGNWPESIVQKVALALGAKGSQLLRIPAPQRRPSLEIVITADVAQPTAARADIVLRNELHWAVAGWPQTVDGAKLRSRLSRLLGQRVRGVLFTAFAIKRSTAQETVLTAHADLSHYVVSAQQQIYLPRAPLILVPTRLLDRAGDPWAITVGQRESIDLELRLRAPGYHSSALGSSRMEAAGVEYLSELSATADGFRARYRYRQRFKHYAGKRRAAYLSFCRRYRQIRRKMYSLGLGAPAMVKP